MRLHLPPHSQSQLISSLIKFDYNHLLYVTLLNPNSGLAPTTLCQSWCVPIKTLDTIILASQHQMKFLENSGEFHQDFFSVKRYILKNKRRGDIIVILISFSIIIIKPFMSLKKLRYNYKYKYFGGNIYFHFIYYNHSAVSPFFSFWWSEVRVDLLTSTNHSPGWWWCCSFVLPWACHQCWFDDRGVDQTWSASKACSNLPRWTTVVWGSKLLPHKIVCGWTEKWKYITKTLQSKTVWWRAIQVFNSLNSKGSFDHTHCW